MNYDLRSIMIGAHMRRRNFGITVAEALKEEWAAAKRLREPMNDAAFYLNMADRWSNEDYLEAARMGQEIVEQRNAA